MSKRYVVVLSLGERDELDCIVNKGRADARRCRVAAILLAVDDGEHGPALTGPARRRPSRSARSVHRAGRERRVCLRDGGRARCLQAPARSEEAAGLHGRDDQKCTIEVCAPIPATRSHAARYDGEYRRNGIGHIVLFHSPLQNWRDVHVADNHAVGEWAEGARRLDEAHYPDAERITLVMDNLSTHSGASLYDAFEPSHARALLERLEFVFTPKHGNWLNGVAQAWPSASSVCLREGASIPVRSIARRTIEETTVRVC